MRTGNLQTVQYLWAGAAGCGALALWALHRFLVSLRRDRLVADTPLVKIRSAAQGYVKLFGRTAAARDGALAAPLSSRPCVWWRYDVQQKVRNAKGETRWESIDSGSSVDLFVLADADAQCLVGPVNAEITPTTHDVWYGDGARPGGPPPAIGSLTGDYRYTESLLSEGIQVSVLGELRSHSEGSSTDAAAAALLKQWKHDQKALLARFDLNHDGRIDASEWDAARHAAIKEAQSQTLNAPITRMSVISQPTNGEPFLVAAMDDAHLARREKLRAALFLCLGLICVVLCAWAIEHAHALGAASSG
ncbi:MAG: GIDE domain-containing protein [Steroidobacteraceae bacterium]